MQRQKSHQKSGSLLLVVDPFRGAMSMHHAMNRLFMLNLA
jgi:hypothetical protein